MGMDDVMQTFKTKQSEKLTVLEFLRTARKCDIADFLYIITSKCDCYGECPLSKIADMKRDQKLFMCDKCDLMLWLDSELKTGWYK